MDTELLRIFIDVTNSGNFAGVAKDRNVDPSSISRSIAQLENNLGTRLFNRTTRSITLTEAGTLYLERVRPICEELERAQYDVASLQNVVKGRVRFSTSVAFGHHCILPLLPEFRRQYPDLEIDLKFSDQNLDIIAEQLDFVIRLNKFADNNFVRTRLKNSHYRLCASPDYINENASLKKPEDLANHQCLLFDLPQYRETWSFKNAKVRLNNIPVKGHIMLSSATAIRDCAVRGLGIALLADWLVDEDIARGKLVNLFPHYQISAENFETAIWIIYPARAFLPTKTRVTIDFIKESLGTDKLTINTADK